MTQPEIVRAYEAQEDLPQVLGSLGLDFTEKGIEILFDQIIEKSNKVEPVQPQDSVTALRDLHGDPNDEKIIKELEDTKVKDNKDGRMNGTYLITEMSQEAAIEKIMLNIIK